LAVLKKTARQGHSEECRMRIEKAMEGSSKVVEAKRRRKEFVKDAAEAEEKIKEKEKKTTVEMEVEGAACSSGTTPVERAEGRKKGKRK
jgi:hypothetical protein